MAETPPVPLPVACDDPLPEPAPDQGKGKKKKREERREKGPAEKAALTIAWLFLLGALAASWFWKPPEGQQATSLLLRGALAGSKELIAFLYEHLVSAMIPAFFLAAAISTFFSKETIIKAMGRQANPFVSYPIASLAGAILTVCSCGVLPIFMSILQSGAGLGPAITFLYASPAINLISLIYTWKILPASMLWGRVISVAVSSIAIGVIMFLLFRDTPSETETEDTPGKPTTRTATQEGVFFLLLVLVMLTSTDALAFVTRRLVPPGVFASADPEWAIRMAALAGKLLAIGIEVVVVVLVLRAWFTWDETRKWLKRTGRQASEIIPMVFLGIFYSGMLGGAPSMVDYLGLVRENTVVANLLAAAIGAVMYFGSIVGVNVVDLFMRWGMHKGPALALLLAGPTVSLPSVLALLPIIGRTKTFVFLALVVLFSAAGGLIAGWF
ncbi:MAG: hypothetical protein GX442_03175 [Candidatus Riflebacteria bacterium]|nr:hypothetical protein [Candidatus Riflebacteria bacterium]